MKHPIHRRLLTLSLAILLTCGMALVPSAWFAGIWDSGSSSIQFAPAGNARLHGMWMWMYYAESDRPTVDSTEPIGWRQQTVTGPYKGEGYGVPESDYTISGDTYIYTAANLHFGKIDNLISLNDDNIVYLCLKLLPADNGREKVMLRFDYHNEDYSSSTDKDPRRAILLHKEGGGRVALLPISTEMINPETDTNYTADEVAAYNEMLPIQYDPDDLSSTRFLQYSYCISTGYTDTNGDILPYAPGTAGFDAMTFSQDYPIGTYCDGSAGAQPEVDLTTYVPDIATRTDPIFLYIRLTPRLETFGLQEKILDYFVPSFILFDTRLEIEVH